MRAIQTYLHEELKAFLDHDERWYFEQEEFEVFKCLTSEQWIGDNNYRVAYETFPDFSIVSELGTFVDELKTWAEEVDAIRREWYWESEVYILPEDYISVFGCTSPVAVRLPLILNRIRRVVAHLDRIEQADARLGRKELSDLLRKDGNRRPDPTIINQWAKKHKSFPPEDKNGKRSKLEFIAFVRDNYPKYEIISHLP